MLVRITLTVLLLAVGSLGGAIAAQFPVPLPWMLGSLVTAGLAASFVTLPVLRDYAFPNDLRAYFVALIGVMIGTQVDSTLLAQLVHLPWSLPALFIFVVTAHFANYQLFSRWGGMTAPTAFYGGAPGGLIESVMMGEAAGANIKMLTMLQFMRIIVVISLVPIALSLWMGTPVGSASGQSLAGAESVSNPVDIALIVGVAVIGLATARWVHLPAAQLVGPLLLAGGLTLSGLLDVQLPGWMVAAAQVVVGTSLGLRFKGLSRHEIGAALRLSCVSVAIMLGLGLSLSLALAWLTGIPVLHLVISFAPGGLIEMSIIALSLAANPALVTAHHVIRILMTVAVMTAVAKRLGLEPKS